jgi:hypothetical protein
MGWFTSSCEDVLWIHKCCSCHSAVLTELEGVIENFISHIFKYLLAGHFSFQEAALLIVFKK